MSRGGGCRQGESRRAPSFSPAAPALIPSGASEGGCSVVSKALRRRPQEPPQDTASGRPERPCVGLLKDDLVKKGGQIDAARLELGRAVQQVSPASFRQLSGNAD